jgi:superfamily II DNA or RNA helicase
MDAVGIYADEVHHFSAKTCKNIMMKSPNAYYRFGGSATPQRTDNSYLTIEGLFGRKISVVTASDLIRKKFLVKPTIRFLDLKQKPFLVNSWAEDRKQHIVENQKRNDYIVQLARILMGQNIKTMILVQLISHGKALKKMIPGSIFLHGSSPKKERRTVLSDFAKGKVPLLIGSVIADEGLDLPCLAGLILAGGGKAATRAKQRVGRAIRVDPLVPYNEQKSLIFDFMDKGRWVEEHSWERMNILKEEEEFDVKIVSAENALVVQNDLF